MQATKKYMIFKTVIMVLGPAAMGIYLEIAGPTLPDLKNKLNSTYEEISRVLVARSVGYFLSSILAGILVDCYPVFTELFLSSAFLLGSLGTGVIPWCNGLLSMAAMFHLQGLGEGLIDTCNNTLCARIWKKKAGTPLHALHFGFGMGAIAAPFLARPFISNIDVLQTGSTNLNGSSSINSTSVYSESWHIPYIISSLFTALFSVVFFGFYLYEKYAGIQFTAEDKSLPLKGNTVDIKLNTVDVKSTGNNVNGSESQDLNTSDAYEEKVTTFSKMIQLFSPGACAGGDVLFGFKIFILTFLFYLNIVGGERAYGKFIYSYAISCDASVTKDEATFINSLFWMFFTSGRGIAIILSKFIRPSILLFVELMCNISISIILCIWGYEVKLILYIFSALLGIALSPVFPGGMAFLNNYIIFKGIAVSIVFTGGATGGFIYQWLTGVLFDAFGPVSLMFVMLGYSLVLSTVFMLMSLVTFRRKYRFENNETKMTEVDR